MGEWKEEEGIPSKVSSGEYGMIFEVSFHDVLLVVFGILGIIGPSVTVLILIPLRKNTEATNRLEATISKIAEKLDSHITHKNEHDTWVRDEIRSLHSELDELRRDVR
jgi:hypothetical protein